MRIGWFSTGNGEGSRRLLTAVQERIQRGDLPVEIAFVFCNRGPGEHEGSDRYAALVQSYGIPLVRHSSRDFRRRVGPVSENRDAYDREVMALIEPYGVDVIALAGYMLIVSGAMCRRYTLLNLHPALPDGPIGTWQDVIWTLIDHRADRAGGMIHVATEDVDRGPVLSYFTFPLHTPESARLWREIEGRPVADLRREHGESLPLFAWVRGQQLKREPLLLGETLRAVATGQVKVRGGKVLDAKGNVVAGVNLDAAIENALGARR